MKTILLTVATVFAFSANTFAQAPKNVKSETKTTITTIKDSQGEKKLVKTEYLFMEKSSLFLQNSIFIF